ncbi:DUF2721 domain-containing protein [Lichenicoccus roseus]|uniref:DUF2721 domain-containing protein n=1 Tax=Lichenicoccus roseus TaxID=2683649 RepID=A0A5R9JDK9_9PROT|nr:DUF2721 domain-containing protein [Lichenicoccus roseus]TLU73496.1 DUF2721 domain-containing protein [Lichenicoccus roseus]
MVFPFTAMVANQSVDDVAHIIQVALTPVFMLSGIGTLLNLFNTRLARVSDHLEAIAEHQDGLRAGPDPADAAAPAMLLRHSRRLHQRVVMLDMSIGLGAVGGAATCGAALVLFLGSLRNAGAGSWLVLLFGVALVCTMGALAAFIGDSLLAWHGLRMEGPLPRSGSGHAK